MTATNVIHIGRHRCWFEPPDVVFQKWHGDVSPDDMRRMFDAIEQFSAFCPNLLTLSDVSDSGTPSAEARKVGIEDSRGKLAPVRAVFGASFHVRVVVTMLLKAGKLMKSSDGVNVAFFADESKARQWLEEQRRIHRRCSVV